MSVSFDEFRRPLDVESEELLDTVQPVIIGIPCYHWVPTAFFANFVNLARVGDYPIQITNGVYLPQAMRHIVKTVLDIPGWKRLIIVEQDMILPPDAIVKHALHTDAVVGSVYFQHRPPHHLNVMLQNAEGKIAHLTPVGVATMLSRPALYKCDVVGMGCTSIRRDVLENWPRDVAMFRNDWLAEAQDDPFTGGEVSHDVWFCQRVREQGYDIYLDSSIRCEHLTEGAVNDRHYLAAHADELGLQVQVQGDAERSKLIMPNRKERRELARARR